jgi:hypothetical protein
MSWDDDMHTAFDQEPKICEWNYEEFIHEDILESIDSSSPDFKSLLKFMNFTQKTQYELLQEYKAQFSAMMPLLA